MVRVSRIPVSLRGASSFLLRKFLYVNHLSDYGVLDTGDSFEIVRIKPETREGQRSMRP
jgi:hypothetical protein